MFIWLNPDTTNLDRYSHKKEVILSFQRIVLALLRKHKSNIPGINSNVLRWNLSNNKKTICALQDIQTIHLSPDEILCPLSVFFQLEDVIENNQKILETLAYFAQFLKNILYRLHDDAMTFR